MLKNENLTKFKPMLYHIPWLYSMDIEQTKHTRHRPCPIEDVGALDFSV